MNIENNFVPYNIALELKNLGFDEPCLKQGNPHGHIIWRFGCTDDENDTLTIKDIISQKLHEDFIGIPLYQNVQNWLLEKHGIWVEVAFYYNPHKLDKKFFEYGISNVNKGEEGLMSNIIKRINDNWIESPNKYNLFDTPQEAYNSAFEFCLKNLIK